MFLSNSSSQDLVDFLTGVWVEQSEWLRKDLGNVIFGVFITRMPIGWLRREVYMTYAWTIEVCLN